MVAMKNATDNANQMIKDLTLEYNKLRQLITNELLEIASASRRLDNQPSSFSLRKGRLTSAALFCGQYDLKEFLQRYRCLLGKC